METKFQSISIPDFQEKYGTPDKCLQILVDQKWKNGFICAKCKGLNYCKAVRLYDRQCTKCRYVQSPTAGTLFHKVKFSLEKAFLIIYLISTNKKGISSTELSRKTGLLQKTAWLFRMKVLQAMESSDRHPLEGLVDLKIIKLPKEEVDKDGKRKSVKKQVVIGIEKKSNGAARIYSRLLNHNTKSEFKQFVTTKISQDARIKSCTWCATNFGELSETFHNYCPEDQSNKEFGLMKRVSSGLEAWLKGMHGKVQHLQFYLNEYCYRHNRHRMKSEIFDDLLTRMVEHEPRPYYELIA